MLSLQIFSKENPENLFFVIGNELQKWKKQHQRSTTENASQQQLTKPIFSH